MKSIHVPDMRCEKCVARITRALEEAGIAGTVTLESKTVEIDEANEAAVREALDDLGFTAE